MNYAQEAHELQENSSDADFKRIKINRSSAHGSSQPRLNDTAPTGLEASNSIQGLVGDKLLGKAEKSIHGSHGVFHKNISQLERSNNTVNMHLLKASTDAQTRLAETVQNIHELTNASIINESVEQPHKLQESQTQLINNNSSLLKIDTALEQSLNIGDYDMYTKEPTPNEKVNE